EAAGEGVPVRGLRLGAAFHGRGRGEGRGGRPPPGAPDGVGEGDGGLVDACHRRPPPQ
ncbi:MAG: Pterin-4-alpha-carbinolamine dehydratase, partial [uncultured Rubrobacteraceae bacterium]